MCVHESYTCSVLVAKEVKYDSSSSLLCFFLSRPWTEATASMQELCGVEGVGGISPSNV